MGADVGSCYRCGSSGESGRYCRGCGAPILSMASSPKRRGLKRMFRVRLSSRGGAIFLGVALVLFGGTVFLGVNSMRRVTADGVCFAGPFGGSATWPYNPALGNLRLTYYLPTATTSVKRLYDRAAIASFESWSKAWPVFRFRRVDRQAIAQITVAYGSYGRTGAWLNHAGLTVPDFEMFGCSLTHARIQINNSYLVSKGAVLYPVHMLRHLFVHEIGHALGLKHVYSPIASVMVPTSNAYIYVRPQKYDIATVAAIYPASGLVHLLSPVMASRAQPEAYRWHNSLTFAGRP